MMFKFFRKKEIEMAERELERIAGEAEKIDAQRIDALYKIAQNYLKLMKYLSKDNRKPTSLEIDYPNIVTDVGTFDFLSMRNLPASLQELHYEIDALTAEYGFEHEEIEAALLEKINQEW